MAGLIAHVHVVDDEGDNHVFGPGDALPDWALARIGSHCFDGGEHPRPELAEPVAHDAPKGTQEPGKPADSEIPRKAGPGSSTDAWAAYAAKHGVAVDADPKRDEIIAALEAANIPTE